MKRAKILLSFLCLSCATVEYNILTGKQNLFLISDEKEISLGKRLAQEVEEEFEIIKDPRIRDRVNRIGYKLVEVCDRKSIIYHFEAVEKKEGKEEPNAFALPGGYVYINRPLLEMIETDDELAAVLAHEISHIVLRHSILKLQEAIGTQALFAILAPKAPDVQTVKRARAALILLLLSYSKERELEADRLAIKYLKRAGFDPKGLISILEKLKEYQFKSPIRKYRLHTHPYTDERIKAIKAELSTNFSIDEHLN